MAPVPIWPVLNYRDARAASEFLQRTFGFTESLVVPGADPSIVAHGELAWPGGGGVMFHSAGRDDSEFSRLPTGAASLYLVVEDPDTLYERATAAGAEVVEELADSDYGSRGFTVRDPEGNLWSLGTYAGAT